MADFITHITHEDFLKLGMFEADKNSVYAIHCEGDTYFDRKLGTKEYVYLPNVEKVYSKRGHWQVHTKEDTYKINKSETSKIYYIHE